MPEPTTQALTCAWCTRQMRDGEMAAPMPQVRRWADDAKLEMENDGDAFHGACAKLVKRAVRMRHTAGRYA